MNIHYGIPKLKSMKLAKLRINYGRTINLGNYESERIDVSLETDVEEENWMNEADILFSLLKAKVAEYDKLVKELSGN